MGVQVRPGVVHLGDYRSGLVTGAHGGSTGGSGPSGNGLLLEDGSSFLLLEDGSFLLLEG